MCMRHRYAPQSATTPASSGSPRSAVTSLTSSAPSSSARRATPALDVSMESGTPVSPSSTGSTRASSSSVLTASAPGRVDSPPTSTSAAPSATRRRPWATALPTDEKSPPSEKLSGVTLRTPITAGRGQRSSMGITARLMPLSLPPCVKSATIPTHERTTDQHIGQHRPARAPARDRVLHPALHRHARLLQLLLGVQDAGRDEAAHRRGPRRRPRPRDLDPDQPRQRVRHPFGGGEHVRRERPAEAGDRLDRALALPVRVPDHHGDRVVRESSGLAQPLLGERVHHGAR